MEILSSRKVCPYCKQETFNFTKRIKLFFSKTKSCSNFGRLVEGFVPFILSPWILGPIVIPLVFQFDFAFSFGSEFYSYFFPLSAILLPMTFFHIFFLKPVNHDIYSSVPCVSCKKYDTIYYKKNDKVCINCTNKYAKIFK